MFTGIVTDRGRVRSVRRRGDTRIEIETAYDTASLAIGASVCCAGCCLTVIDKGPGWFAVEASAETLSRTTLGNWAEGAPVNLERALRAGDELGGHIVSGHVDGVSLTVNEAAGNRFGVNVIPHTRQATTLGALKAGDRVNLEIDMLARYVARLLGTPTA